MDVTLIAQFIVGKDLNDSVTLGTFGSTGPRSGRSTAIGLTLPHSPMSAMGQ